MVMEYLGVVIEVKNDRAFLMTDSCEVVCIRKQPGMYEGMEVTFEQSEKINKMNSVVKYSPIIGSVAAVFIAVLLYVNLMYSNQIYAYINIDINTNWELMIDKNNRVIDIKSHDTNSEFLFEELNFKSKPLETVLVDMVEELDKNGLIDLNTDNKILITACLNDKEEKQIDQNGLKNLEGKIKNELSSRNIQPYFTQIKSDDRKLAADNNISMSRYSIFKIWEEQGIDIDIENLKQIKIDEILEKVDIVEDSKNLNNDTIGELNQNNVSQKVDDKENKIEENDNVSYESGNIDLDVGGINDIDNIKSIESANIETQKTILKIQQQINNDVAFETEKANSEISKIKFDGSLSSNEKSRRIKQIELDLIKRIDEIKQIGNEKAQAELTKLAKKANDLLPEIK